MCKQLQQAGTI